MDDVTNRAAFPPDQDPHTDRRTNLRILSSLAPSHSARTLARHGRLEAFFYFTEKMGIALGDSRKHKKTLPFPPREVLDSLNHSFGSRPETPAGGMGRLYYNRRLFALPPYSPHTSPASFSSCLNLLSVYASRTLFLLLFFFLLATCSSLDWTMGWNFGREMEGGNFVVEAEEDVFEKERLGGPRRHAGGGLPAEGKLEGREGRRDARGMGAGCRGMMFEPAGSRFCRGRATCGIRTLRRTNGTAHHDAAFAPPPRLFDCEKAAPFCLSFPPLPRLSVALSRHGAQGLARKENGFSCQLGVSIPKRTFSCS